MRICLAALLVLATSCATPTAGGEGGKHRLIAVLPISAPGVEESLRTALEEEIRTLTGDLLGRANFTVLNGENTLRVLADNGIDAVKACEASCALEAAQELKVDAFLSGTLQVAEGEFLAFIRLADTKTGRQLGSVKLEGARVRELRRQFEAKASDLFESGLGVTIARKEPVPVVKREEPRPRDPGAKAPRTVVRAGFGSHLGILGIGLERVFDVEDGRSLRLAFGTGTHLLSGGFSWAPPSLDEAGFYLDLHVTWQRAGLLGAPLDAGIGGGATAGWEQPLLPWLNVKAGAGLAYTTSRGGGLVFDLSAGPTF